ncbi:MAG: SDR family oxidoreductase, partial [Solirubrobacterales bacterium]|nr:SDR family oxidoreductase [Solirubrobacterales bacterium]
MDLGLRERACVVTGASGGIGRATALALAREGASLVLVGRREERLAALARECEQDGARSASLVLDLTAVDAGERILDACLERFGRIDALVNGAGTSAVRTPEQLTDEEWQGQWELHVMAPMRLMRAAAPAMADRGWGRIVNVCSSSGKRPSGTNMAYSVTKAAELSLSRAFADLYAGRGVLVNAVAPGPVGGELWLAPGGLAEQQA